MTRSIILVSFGSSIISPNKEISKLETVHKNLFRKVPFPEKKPCYFSFSKEKELQARQHHLNRLFTQFSPDNPFKEINFPRSLTCMHILALKKIEM